MNDRLTVTGLVQHFLPRQDPLALDKRLLFLVSQAVELHDKSVADSREATVEHVRQILMPLIREAGGQKGGEL
jgi:hypothetical protein